MFIETAGRIFGLDGIGNRVTQSTVARGREDPSGTELCLGHPTLLLILSLYIIFGGVGGTIKKNVVIDGRTRARRSFRYGVMSRTSSTIIYYVTIHHI